MRGRRFLLFLILISFFFFLPNAVLAKGEVKNIIVEEGERENPISIWEVDKQTAERVAKALNEEFKLSDSQTVPTTDLFLEEMSFKVDDEDQELIAFVAAGKKGERVIIQASPKYKEFISKLLEDDQ